MKLKKINLLHALIISFLIGVAGATLPHLPRLLGAGIITGIIGTILAWIYNNYLAQTNEKEKKEEEKPQQQSSENKE